MRQESGGFRPHHIEILAHEHTVDVLDDVHVAVYCYLHNML